MKINDALAMLFEWDSKGRYIFSLRDFAKIFYNEKPKTLQESIRRLVSAGVLIRVSKGVYMFAYTKNKDKDTIFHLARAFRRGDQNYVSLESALSDYGLISQIPVDRLTVVTTGRSGEYKTPFGIIEFTHTKRGLLEVINSYYDVDKPLPLATKKAALRDLKRVGRNTHLIDMSAIKDD